jgi:hypothetical protein
MSGSETLIDCGAGFALMDTGSCTPVHQNLFSIDDPCARVQNLKIARQGGFIENNTKIVTGSSIGEVQVYARHGGHPLFILPHGTAPARTIAVSHVQAMGRCANERRLLTDQQKA